MLVLMSYFFRKQSFWLLAAILVLTAGTQAADTLRVSTLNALNFAGTPDASRIPSFRTVMRAIAPDMACFQEITADDAVDQLLTNVFLQLDGDWAAVPFHNGRDTDNAFFYRTSKVQLVSVFYLTTTLRDIAEYVVRPAAGDTSLRIRIYSLHLKANSGSGDQSANIERRRQEATTLRAHLDQLAPNSLFMVCGDYNLLYSDEPAYQALLASSNPNGQCNDPINTPGDWDSNPAFAAVHSIGTRSGLNARFDFILVSDALMDSVGSHVLPQTYTAYGNDGRHFGRAINNGTNYAVPDSVANALYSESDHLPVTTQFVITSEAAVKDVRPVAREFNLLTCYPNPFNPSLNIEVGALRETSTLQIFDALGRQVYLRELSASPGAVTPLTIGFASQGTGAYFVRLMSAHQSEIRKVMLLR
jgi:hypothetical protein